jgi:large subunit ribosomal protein L21
MAPSPMASSTSYAIVESGGKQYRAEKGASLLVEHLSVDEGAKVSLRAVMYRGDTEVVLGGNELEKVKVEAVVAEHLRGPKVRIFKYKPKKGYRRRAGHRQELTRLEVTDVKLLTRKPAAKAETKPAAKAETKPTEKVEAKPVARKPAAKKPAAKKPAAKKPAAKKPAAKKPAAKKPAAKTPAGRGKTQTRKASTARRAPSAKKET